METKKFWRRCLEVASGEVLATKPGDFAKPTPDTEWSVRNLLGHMLYELAWVADILAGKTIAEVGDKYSGDLLGENFQANWQNYAEAALKQLRQVNLSNTVHLSYGDVNAEHYLWQNGSDLAIHGWDLGEAIGHPVVFDNDLVEALYDHAADRKDDMRASGLFGEAVPTTSADRLQTKLLGIYGRHG